MNKALPLLSLFLLPIVGCGSSANADLQAPKGFAEGLKNDAFAYYGLGNDKVVNLEISYGPNSPTLPATRKIEFVKMDGENAIFIQKQTGALENEGDITFSLEKDGLFVMKSSKNKVKPHSLEMPAKLEVGKGWTDRTEMTQGSGGSEQEIKLDNDLKIVGKERVATPGGTFDDALHVTSTGKGKLGSQDVTLKTQHWYVRGVGPVKQVVEVLSKDGPARTVTVQLAAPAKAEEKAPEKPAPGAKK